MSVHPRTQSRRRALDILFSADVMSEPIADVLRRSAGVDKVAAAIVSGVNEHREAIDDLIRKYASGWTLERMPVVDRNLLRIGIYELLYAAEVPAGAAINDAVELAKQLSTEDSGRFVNGMLGRIDREHRK